MDVEIVQTKECDYCYKYIDVRASRCPFCCTVLVTKTNYKRSRAVFAGVALVMGVAAVLGWRSSFALTEQLIANDRRFSDLVTRLQKAETRLLTTKTVNTIAKQQEPSVEFVLLRSDLDLEILQMLISCNSLVGNVACFPTDQGAMRR